MSKMERTWERIQQKTFTKWVNSHLKKRSLAIENLQTDLCDGLKLIQFLEIIAGKELGRRYDKKPRMRIQMVQNVYHCMNFIAECNVKLVAIQAEDIVDGNLKLILGMIWTIIQRFQIEDISEEEMTAKEALLLWCKKKTAGYKDVKVENFHTTWSDGLAFCALIHKHRPDLLDFSKLSKDDPAHNLKLAFDVAEQHLDIPALLDVEDMMVEKPDERSVITYVSAMYHVFSKYGGAEAAGRRLGKLADLEAELAAMIKDYEHRAGELKKWIGDSTERQKDREFDNTLPGVLDKISQFSTYKGEEKPPRAANRVELEALYNALQMKLRANNRPAYQAPAGLSPAEINTDWGVMEDEERAREKALREELERQQKIDAARRRFGQRADKLEKWIAAKKAYLATNEAQNVASLSDAEMKIRVLDAYGKEYGLKKKDVDALQAIADELSSLRAPDADAIQERSKKIKGDYDALPADEEAKRKRLTEALELQRRMEACRMAWAKAAKEYQRQVRQATAKTKVHDFGGDSLEAVEAAGETLNKQDAAHSEADAAKLGELQKIWNELEELKISDDRKYSPLTIDDCKSMSSNLASTQAARKEAYEKELARQRELEKMRVEFARRAKEIEAAIEARRGAINALTADDSAALIAKIKDEFKDGAAESASVASLGEYAQEMSAAGITSNPHTELTVPALEQQVRALVSWVAAYVRALEEEQRLRDLYAERAARQRDWLATAVPAQQAAVEFDNTLQGAKAKSAEHSQWKAVEKSRRALERIEVQETHAKLVALLKKNNRPDYVAPDGLSLDALGAQWTTLDEAEKARDAAIAKELERQQALVRLVRSFQAGEQELQLFVGEKKEYLGVDERERVTSVNSAQTRIKLLEAYRDEEKRARSKADALAKIVAQIEENKGSQLDDVKARHAAAVASIDGLTPQADAKGKLLDELLEVEKKKEAARVKYAQLVDAHEQWVSKQETALAAVNFGDTLEKVQAYAKVLEESDASVRADAAAKLDEIKKAAEELTALGVTENTHTSKTVADAEATGKAIEQAIDRRAAAYREELNRQIEMETRRKQFAEMADAFVAAIDAHKKEIDALSGEPAALIAAITTSFDDGKKETALLDELKQLDAEMKRLGISDNKHTPYNVSMLAGKQREFNDYVKAKLAFVRREQEMKERYQERATRLAAAIAKASDGAKSREFPNTLEGMRAEYQRWIEYKSGTRASNDIERDALAALYNEIAKMCEEFSRPSSWSVAEGTSTEALAAAWSALSDEEKAHEAALNDELQRQEQLSKLVREFNNSAQDVDDWAASKEAYVAERETVESLESARLQRLMLDLFDDELRAHNDQADKLGAQCGEIGELRYHDHDAIKARHAALAERLAKLATAAKEKRAASEEACAREERRDAARQKFAAAAEELRAFSSEYVSSSSSAAQSFPTELDKLSAHSAAVDKEVGDAAAQRAKLYDEAVVATAIAGLAAEGIDTASCASYTSETEASCEKNAAAITKASDEYKAAYAAALAAEEARETKRKAFASAADAYSAAMEAASTKLDDISKSPDASSVDEARAAHAKVESLVNDTKAALQAPADAVDGADGECRSASISAASNKHTRHTAQSLKARRNQLDAALDAALAEAKEDIDVQEKAAEQEAALAATRAREEKRTQLFDTASELVAWLDEADEVISEPISCTSVAQAEELQQRTNALVEARSATYEAKHGEVQRLAKELADAGLTDTGVPVDAIATRWTEIGSAAPARQEAVAAEVTRQTEDEQLRKDAAAQLNEFSSFLDAQASALSAAQAEKDLKVQLTKLSPIKSTLSGDGKKRIGDVDALNRKLLDRGVLDNKHTEHTASGAQQRYDGLVSAVVAAEKTAVAELDRLEGNTNTVSQEQLSEYREMFDFFDKNKTGTLNALEFSGLLRSLGESGSEAEDRALFDRIRGSGNEISFDAFTAYMVDKNKDTVSSSEIFESFKELAGGKDHITQSELARALPAEKVEYLVGAMPKHAAGDDCYDYAAYCKNVF